jgi:hypothetical protein
MKKGEGMELIIEWNHLRKKNSLGELDWRRRKEF